MTDFETRLIAAKRHIRAHSIDGIERRVVPSTVELRAKGDWFRVVGHGAVFNSLSENLGGFREVIEPGFFDNVLNDDVRALVNHDPNLVMARTKVPEGPGQLLLQQDRVGLAYDFEPTRTSFANDLRSNLDAGVITQSSFAFRVGRGGDSWEVDEETDMLIRTLLKGGCSRLFDVSSVTYPAYEAADSGLASLPLEDEGEEVPSTDEDDPAPDPERVADEGTPPSAADDGGTEDGEADERSALEQRRERLRLRIGEPPL